MTLLFSMNLEFSWGEIPTRRITRTMGGHSYRTNTASGL